MTTATARRRANVTRALALVLASAGVLHFVASLFLWGCFYVGSYRNGWKRIFTVGYTAAHLVPALGLMGLFAWAAVAPLRRRRGAVALVALALLAAAITFAVEARGEPQFYRVWFDDPLSCSNRESVYCTWWWWRPRRH